MTVLSNDGLLAISDLLGMQSFPVVLAVAPTQDTVDDLLAARRSAVAELTAAGMVDRYGDVADDLAAALHVLARPDRQLTARIVGEDAVSRVCVARRGLGHALAVRDRDHYRIETVWADDDPAGLARLLAAPMPACPPADIGGFGGPTSELRERLDAADDSAAFADLAYHYGSAERDAMRFGLAMSTCRRRAEIVAYSHEQSQVRTAAAAVVYDTDHGRIVVVPSTTADGQTWSTFAPGTDHRLARGVSALIESLPGGRWMP